MSELWKAGDIATMPDGDEETVVIIDHESTRVGHFWFRVVKDEDGLIGGAIGTVSSAELKPPTSAKALLWGHAAKLRLEVERLERALEKARRQHEAVTEASRVLGLAPCPF